MRSIALVLVVLVSTQALYTNKYPIEFSNRRNIMAVMVEVENKLKIGSPIDTVKGVLDGFKSAVNEEQLTHDEVYQRQKTECEGELSYREQEVGDAAAALKAAQQQLRTCTLQQGKTQAALTRTEESLIQNRQHLDIINEVRRLETVQFNKAAVTFNDAINAIDDAVDLATSITNGGSFIEVAKITGRFAQHAIKLNQISQYKGVIGALAQLSQDNVDQADVERLVQLLATLRTNLENAWSDFTNENNSGISAFNDQKDRYNGNIGRLENLESKLTNQLEELSGCIAVQTAISQSNSNKQQRNQLLLDDATELCQILDDEFAATTAGRRQELQLIQELDHLVDRRFQQVSQGE